MAQTLGFSEEEAGADEEEKKEDNSEAENVEHEDIADFMRDDVMDLLVASPNNREKQMLGKDKFVINPSSKSSEKISEFEFLGILMGVCIRTGARLTLDLPAFLWKQLVGQRLTLLDLEEIDVGFVKMLEFLKTATQEEQEKNMDGFTWTI